MSRAAGPRTVAVVPARSGATGVAGPGLWRVGGVPLVERAVRACRAAELVDEVVVATDDDGIAAAAVAAGARVVRRPAEPAGTPEADLLHALHTLPDQPTVVVLVDCTSPFIDPADLDAGITLVAARAADSAFAAVETSAFLWRRTAARDAPLVTGVNHAAHRPRQHDREPDLRETGAFYVLDVAGFRRAGQRFFGRTAAVSVAEHSAVEVADLTGLAVAETLAPLVVGRSPAAAGVSPDGLRSPRPPSGGW